MFWKTTTKIKAKSPKHQQKKDAFTVPHSPFQLPFNHLKPKCFIMMFSLFPHVSSLFPHCFPKFLPCYPHFSLMLSSCSPPFFLSFFQVPPHFSSVFPGFFPVSPIFPGFFPGFSPPPQVPIKAPLRPSPAPRAAIPGAAARRRRRRRSTPWRCAAGASPGRRRRAEPLGNNEGHGIFHGNFHRKMEVEWDFIVV